MEGLAGTSLGISQAGVDLDQVDGDEVAGLVNGLADVVTLAQGQAATDGGAGGSSPGRVESVNVEGQVNGGVGTDVGKGHLDDAANTVAADNVLANVLEASGKGKNVPINVKHAEGLDAVLAQNLLLANVDVAQTNVDELLDVEHVLVLEPAKVLLLLFLGQTSQEGQGHAVDVARVGVLGSVDVSVGVDPDDGNLAAEALARSLGRARDGANGNAVVTAEGEGKTALARLLVGLLGDGLVDSGDGLGVLHAAVVGILSGNGEHLDVRVAVQLVTELVADLVQQTGLDQGLGAIVDTSLGLLVARVSWALVLSRECNVPDRQRSQRRQRRGPGGWRGSGSE